MRPIFRLYFTLAVGGLGPNLSRSIFSQRRRPLHRQAQLSRRHGSQRKSCTLPLQPVLEAFYFSFFWILKGHTSLYIVSTWQYTSTPRRFGTLDRRLPCPRRYHPHTTNIPRFGLLFFSFCLSSWLERLSTFLCGKNAGIVLSLRSTDTRVGFDCMAEVNKSESRTKSERQLRVDSIGCQPQGGERNHTASTGKLHIVLCGRHWKRETKRKKPENRKTFFFFGGRINWYYVLRIP